MKIVFEKINVSHKVIVAEINESTEILFSEINKDLSEIETEFYKSLKNERRKSEWLGVRILLKKLLGHYSEIKYNPSGNPYIENDLNISITHSKNILGIILSKKRDIGMDVEILSDKILRTAHKFITDEELKLFNESDKIKKIYLNWCCKETLFKIKEHGGFDFKTNFKVTDSPVEKSGTKQTFILYKDYTENYTLNYEFINYKEFELLVVWH